MTRRRHKPVNQRTGGPTIDQTPQTPSRRHFRLLTDGGGFTPTPAFGRVYRTVKASIVADYSGYSTMAFTSGTTGGPDNWNCLYVQVTTPDQKVVPIDEIAGPIRWQLDGPAIDGDTYDWWSKAFTAAAGASSWDGRFVGPGLGAGFADNQRRVQGANTPNWEAVFPGLIDTVLVSGTHGQFSDGDAILEVVPLPRQPSLRSRGSLLWWESTLDALSTNQKMHSYNNTGFVTVNVAYINHYVNAVDTGGTQAVGSNGGGQLGSGDAAAVVAMSEGDSYYVDVWYRIQTIGQPLNTSPGKMVYYIPTTRVSSGTRRAIGKPEDLTSYVYAELVPSIRFRNVNYSPNFDADTHTYQLTAVGHAGWTLFRGSNGPHKMLTTTGATASIHAGSIFWQLADNEWVKEIRLSWQHEIAVLLLKPGTTLEDSLEGYDEIEWLQYRPQSNATYADDTVSTDYGAVLHGPSGTFSQSGTTTFELVEWSVKADLFYGAQRTNRGFDAGALLSTAPEIPTSFTVTRTTL